MSLKNAERKRNLYEHFIITLRYDPGIMSVMLVAGGCLTKKKTKECLAILM
jgi:hypothetical protein